MRIAKALHCTWLLPCLLLAASQFSTPVAGGEAPACGSLPGGAAVHRGGELDSVLDVLSWNIQKARNAGWAEDLVSFADGVDLAFIQEASLGAGIPDVLSGSLFEAFAEGYTTADERTGVMTLSAAAPSGHCRLTAREPWLGTPKATGITEYALRGSDEPLLAVNLHAVNFELAPTRFRSQFRALGDVLDGHTGPVIVAGDMNTWSAGRQSLVDAFMAEHGLGSVRFEDDLRTRAFGRALDHIYVRGLQAEAARVIPVVSSDHNPLRVRLAVQ